MASVGPEWAGDSPWARVDRQRRPQSGRPWSDRRGASSWRGRTSRFRCRSAPPMFTCL